MKSKAKISKKKIQSKYYESIRATPVIAAIVKLHIDMQKFSPGVPRSLTCYVSTSAYAILQDGVCVAFINFGVEDKVCFIYNGWVDPDYRKLGLYNALWIQLIIRGKKENWTAIESGIYPDNDTMLSVAAAQGRQKVAEIWQYRF